MRRHRACARVCADPQGILGLLQHLAPARGQGRAGAIDVEREHRHRRTKRIALAPMAAFGRVLQRARNLHRIV
jgi:hypothetical protein